MRSSVRFVMHPDDELEFEENIRKDASVKFVDGPRWPTKFPPVRKSLKDLSGDYCILWSPDDIARLNAEFMAKCNDWYCRSEQLTIQFIRSEIDDSIVTEGQIAFAKLPSEDVRESKWDGIEARYNKLRKFIRKTYKNSVVRWYNSGFPFAPAGPKRSANPSEPDRQVWVGPHAERWLREVPTRRIRQFKTAGCFAFLEGQPPPS